MLFLLFAGSGCAALIYEIVWFQELQLVIGASAVSLAVLLTAFMGGMCAGSLLLPRVISPDKHPLRVFAAIEAAIGFFGALLIVVMPLIGRLYTAIGGGPSSTVLRALASLVLLLPPAMLMGATLPAISRLLPQTPAGVARLGGLYGSNIFGAVIGCLSAGHYLLPSFDLTTASLVAVVINAAVASLASVLARRTLPGAPRLPGQHQPPTAHQSTVYAAIALSGFTALGAEVVWTRLLSLLFGATTYTFSMILALFLAGLGIGSAAGASVVRRGWNPRGLLGGAQIGLSFAIAYAAWAITRWLPYWSTDTSLPPAAALDVYTDMFRTAIAVFPGALLWGASFPLAVSAGFGSSANFIRPPEGKHHELTEADAATAVGRVYAVNTLGAIAGAVLTALVFIPLIGTDGAQRLLIITSTVSAGVALVPRWRPVDFVRASLLGALLTGAVAAATTVSPPSAGLVAWGRLLPWHGEPHALFVGEGVNASIAVTEESNGWHNFHVSGKVEASTEPQDMRLQRMLGHLTALMHATGPKHVLVVGFGAGVTAGALSIHPSVERLVICELEPLIPKVVARYFGDANYDVATDLKARIVYDDARHYVLTTRETFDVITSDPIHPWVKGAATLYSKEYFETVRRHLNPGGVVTQWVPLYESTEDSVRSVIATFLQVFPDGSIWRNDDADGRGYDAVLVGRLDEKPIDIDAWQARLDRPEYEKVRNSLAEVGFGGDGPPDRGPGPPEGGHHEERGYHVVDLLATYLGRGRELGAWLAGAEINTDSNLRLQYLAGDGVNNNTGTQIRDSLLRYRRFPEDLFAGDAATVAWLRERLQQPTSAP